MAILNTENTGYNQHSPFHRPPTVEELLQQARRRIQVSDAELDEARRRRDLIGAALLKEFRDSRVYVNGSVAHGDALNPLTDIDLGVVVAEAKYTHGPGKKGCSDLQERAANAIRAALREEFPGLRVEWRGRRRSILVRFSKAVTYGQDDFTADVIIAVDNPEDEGLFIPNYQTWSRSHPEEHTRLVRAANKATDYTYARVVRLTKHYNRRNQKPLCSWNIKALALDALTSRTPLAQGILTWFDHAITSLSKGLTEDPAHVAEKPISINEKMTRTEVVDRLKKSRERLFNALALEKAGYLVLAHEQLAKFFNDEEMLPYPDLDAVRLETTRKYINDSRTPTGGNTTTPGQTAGSAAVAAPVVGLHHGQSASNSRSWGEG
ncbi:hypothetical protein ACFVDI_02475 [Nocardioides sp. NPDC057767]|uniref:hypothetical protein n=1 Tax=unclassified Nocardioides TaxID=2615069 RepID=UPI0036727BA5